MSVTRNVPVIKWGTNAFTCIMKKDIFIKFLSNNLEEHQKEIWAELKCYISSGSQRHEAEVQARQKSGT